MRPVQSAPQMRLQLADKATAQQRLGMSPPCTHQGLLSAHVQKHGRHPAKLGQGVPTCIMYMRHLLHPPPEVVKGQGALQQ